MALAHDASPLAGVSDPIAVSASESAITIKWRRKERKLKYMKFRNGLKKTGYP